MDTTVSISAASKMAGRSTTTIRRWVREKSITATKTPEGKWLVDHRTLREHLATKTGQHVPNMSGNTAEGIADSELTCTLREALHRERKINDELRSQMKEKDSELLRLTYEMKSVLEGKSGGLISRWIRS